MNGLMEQRVVNGQWCIEKEIGKGGFGQLYEGTEIRTGRKVAIKVEPIVAKSPQLQYESRLYRTFSGGVGIPSLHWYGRDGACNALVMDLMGPSLEDLFRSCERRFSLKTVLMLADQMISRMEYLHGRKFLHRDVKPENFLVGTGQDAGTVHIIDFGFVKKFCDKENKHIPYREGKGWIGTTRYACIAAHLGFEQGRRDDLEALGYVLLYFLSGSLPWQGLREPTHSGLKRRIATIKQKISTEDLCKGLPSEFHEYFRHVRGLRFEEKPDYAMLQKMFKQLALQQGFEDDGIPDWMEAPHSVTQGMLYPSQDSAETWLSAVSQLSCDIHPAFSTDRSCSLSRMSSNKRHSGNSGVLSRKIFDAHGAELLPPASSVPSSNTNVDEFGVWWEDSIRRQREGDGPLCDLINFCEETHGHIGYERSGYEHSDGAT